MQENSIFDLNETKKAGIVNIVGCVLFLVLIITFYIYLKTGSFFDGTNISVPTNSILAFVLSWFGLMFLTQISFICLAFSAMYKIIFAILLLRSCAKNKNGCLYSVDSRIFMVSVIVRVTTIFFLVWMVYLVSSVIAPFTTQQMVFICGLIFAVLAVFELVGIFVEKKAKQEQLTAKQYEPNKEFFN